MPKIRARQRRTTGENDAVIEDHSEVGSPIASAWINGAFHLVSWRRGLVDDVQRSRGNRACIVHHALQAHDRASHDAAQTSAPRTLQLWIKHRGGRTDGGSQGASHGRFQRNAGARFGRYRSREIVDVRDVATRQSSDGRCRCRAQHIRLGEINGDSRRRRIGESESQRTVIATAVCDAMILCAAAGRERQDCGEYCENQVFSWIHANTPRRISPPPLAAKGSWNSPTTLYPSPTFVTWGKTGIAQILKSVAPR